MWQHALGGSGKAAAEAKTTVPTTRLLPRPAPQLETEGLRQAHEAQRQQLLQDVEAQRQQLAEAALQAQEAALQHELALDELREAARREQVRACAGAGGCGSADGRVGWQSVWGAGCRTPDEPRKAARMEEKEEVLAMSRVAPSPYAAGEPVSVEVGRGLVLWEACSSAPNMWAQPEPMRTTRASLQAQLQQRHEEEQQAAAEQHAAEVAALQQQVAEREQEVAALQAQLAAAVAAADTDMQQAEVGGVLSTCQARTAGQLRDVLPGRSRVSAVCGASAGLHCCRA